MPAYQYACVTCGEFTMRRASADYKLPATCPCGQVAPRIFSARFQIIGDPVAYQPENKYADGFSATDRLARVKADQKIYEKSWEGKEVPTRKKTPSMAELYHQMYS